MKAYACGLVAGAAQLLYNLLTYAPANPSQVEAHSRPDTMPSAGGGMDANTTMAYLQV